MSDLAAVAGPGSAAALLPGPAGGGRRSSVTSLLGEGGGLLSPAPATATRRVLTRTVRDDRDDPWHIGTRDPVVADDPAAAFQAWLEARAAQDVPPQLLHSAAEHSHATHACAKARAQAATAQARLAREAAAAHAARKRQLVSGTAKAAQMRR